MATPNKPTNEELDEKIQEALDIPEEELINPPDEEEDESKQVDLSPIEEGEEKEEDSQEPEDEEQAEPSKEVKERLKREVEEKNKKLSASARENQKIYAKNRVINQAILEADEIPVPTDDEMKEIYGDDWDLASDIEKESLKETQISKKWRAKIKEASDQATKIEKWNDSVVAFVEDPQTLIDNPDLEGKTEEFKTFATEETNNSVPFKILVSAFLHEHSASNKPHKGKMFERGLGGSNDKPQIKTGKITLEESRVLRETKYDKWKEMNAKGLIDYNL